nr:RNA-directed DNA polymerase, eukaryota [Tanacetum cinerariifolium]
MGVLIPKLKIISKVRIRALFLMKAGKSSGSFAFILKNRGPVHPTNSSPALVLDDSCFKKFRIHVGIGSYFNSINQPSNSFISNERIVWISIEGLPTNAWTINTFLKIAQKWGEMIVWDDSEEKYLYHKQICLKTKVHVIINENFKVIIKGVVYWIRSKELDAWVPKFSNETDDSSSDEDGSENDFNDAGNMEPGSKQEGFVDDQNFVTSDIPAHESSNEYVSETHDIQNVVSSDDNGNQVHVKENFASSDPFNIYPILRKKGNINPNSKDSDPPFPPGFTHVNAHSSNDEGSASINNNQHSYSGLRHKAKKGWINELCSKHKINFLALQETKIEYVDLFTIKRCWGNLSFDHAVSTSIGNSGGIICVWDSHMFVKDHVATSDYFLAIFDGVAKRWLWVISMNLIDIPLGGYSFTWAHKSATMMSKLDRFLVSEGLLINFPNLLGLCLDRRISDHRPILMCEAKLDYGPTPFPKLVELNKIIDHGNKDVEILIKRASLSKELIDITSKEAIDMSQKAKIRWSIEGDENSKYFHGIINSKRSHLSIRGILHNGDWIDDPTRVKDEFFNHFSKQFSDPSPNRITLDHLFHNRLSVDQVAELERNLSNVEIKNAVWDCGTNKSPGPDGYTFEFFRKFWNIMENDIVDAVSQFFSTCSFLPDDILKSFGFGDKWRRWIAGCLNSAKGFVLVNGSPTTEFKFHRGLKQGNPLSSFLFILVMESLHRSFSKVLEKGLYKGICINNSLLLSHLFYADDTVFVGEWNRSNISTIVRVLKCFHIASGLKINLSKSKLSGIGISKRKIDKAAAIVGYSTLSLPF